MNRLKEHVTLELITILRPKICIISYFKSSFKVLGLSFNFLNVENGNILFYFLRNLLIDKKNIVMLYINCEVLYRAGAPRNMTV